MQFSFNAVFLSPKNCTKGGVALPILMPETFSEYSANKIVFKSTFECTLKVYSANKKISFCYVHLPPPSTAPAIWGKCNNTLTPASIGQ